MPAISRLTGHRSSSRTSRTRVAVAAVAVAALVAAGLLASPAAVAATSTVSPIASRAASGVTADALPTVQIDGVVWSQAIVGNTVYAGGSFANARPAGAPSGTQLVPRANLLAYDITTGALITSFAPSLNGQVKAVAASPDGSRIYVGGQFTTADGQNRYRLAAYSTATGQLVSSFAPTLDAAVNAITVTSNAVYVGGAFSMANGVSRTRLAAFSPTDGSLLGWAPTADNTVDAMQVTPDGSKVVVGGSFANVNGTAAPAITAVDATTGAVYPYAVNTVVKNAGSGSAILALRTDGTSIFGVGYSYGTGNFEGAFSVNPSTGAINWLEDCHGDTYDIYPTADQAYVVSHEHYCSNIGGFPDTNPRNRWQRSTAFTNKATGTVQPNGEGGYANFAGQPSPSLVNWFPNIDTGNYTKQYQGSWTVTGNSQYVVEGGEFLHVNGVAQQGLVRFAVPSIAPNKMGPQVSDSTISPTVTGTTNSTVSVSWPTNWDPDDQVLTYSLYRSGAGSAPVSTTTATSQFWNRPTLSYTDTGLVAGTSYSYWVKVSDPSGNTVTSGQTAATTTGTPPANMPPTASFTASCSAATCSFDATSSTDKDGSVTGYAWNFGDGTTGTGATTSHMYTASGTDTVTLTVTDNGGATNSTSKTVTVTVPAGPVTYAADSFSRTTANGWGTADTGGAWSLSGGAAYFSTGNGVGTMSLSAAGAGVQAALPNLSATNSVQTIDVGTNKDGSGNGTFLTLRSRVSGSSDYELKTRFLPGGVVHLALAIGGGATLTEVNIPSISYQPGAMLRVRFAVTGSGGSTTLSGSVWPVGGTAPAAPQITTTDNTASLQGAGSFAVQGYLSGTSTNAPVALTVDNYQATSS